MGDRKVINFYIPPDFDPELIPRKKRPKNNQLSVRLMLPMTVRCDTCGEYLYKNKKFNSRKETVEGETYLGIPIYRFYIRCTRCGAELTFRTDPENMDYAMEKGASRNFEPNKDHEARIEALKARLGDEDSMQALEAKTMDTKEHLDELDELDEIRSINARHAKSQFEDVLSNLRQRTDKAAEEKEKEELKIAEQIDAAAKKAFRAKAKVVDPDEEDSEAQRAATRGIKAVWGGIKSRKAGGAAAKRKVAPSDPVNKDSDKPSAAAAPAPEPPGGGLGLAGLGDYDSESDPE